MDTVDKSVILIVELYDKFGSRHDSSSDSSSDSSNDSSSDGMDDSKSNIVNMTTDKGTIPSVDGDTSESVNSLYD